MSENQKPRSEADADLEREVRGDRKFSLSEAIGRMAGPGMMKGVTPVSAKRQAETTIEDFLRRNLDDTGGVLGIVLLRSVAESELLLRDLNRPLSVLAKCIKHVLGSDYLLRELVRRTDAEWGRVFGERPYFDRPDDPPHPDDPYTTESVRTALSRLIYKLARDVT
jgi:hypothetical protein